MPIDISERYKLIFAEHHYASDLRIKIFTGWCAIYAALAAAFVWMYSKSPTATWVIPAVGVAITILMWVADVRHRSALWASKKVGAAIEEDESAGIPEDQRFFIHQKAKSWIDKLLTHSMAINLFALGAIVSLVYAASYLYRSCGVLPQ